MGIRKALESFDKLLNYQFRFLIVRKRTEEPISLCFEFQSYNFYHLCGLHKLLDIAEIQVKRKKEKIAIYKAIKNGIYTDALFEKSIYYDKTKDRVECLERLDNILDSSNTIFKYNSIKRNATLIDFDFLIKQTDTNGRNYYLTVESNEKKGLYYGCSCFKRTNIEADFSKGHTSYYVLQKTKKDLITGEEIELYIAPSYKKQLDDERREHEENCLIFGYNNSVVDCRYDDVENVVIPDGVREIGNYAFCGCNKLKCVTIPDSICKFGKSPFANCEALEEVKMSEWVANEFDFEYICKNTPFAKSWSQREIILDNGTDRGR